MVNRCKHNTRTWLPWIRAPQATPNFPRQLISQNCIQSLFRCAHAACGRRVLKKAPPVLSEVASYASRSNRDLVTQHLTIASGYPRGKNTQQPPSIQNLDLSLTVISFATWAQGFASCAHTDVSFIPFLVIPLRFGAVWSDSAHLVTLYCVLRLLHICLRNPRSWC